MRQSATITKTLGLLAVVGIAACESAEDGLLAPQSNITAQAVSLGTFEVCKTYVGAVGGAVTVDYTVDFNGDGLGGPQDIEGMSVQVADGQCVPVHTYDGSQAMGGTQIQRVTVTEQVPGGYAASYVLTSQVGPTVTVFPVANGNSASGDMLSNPDNGFSVEFINTEIFVPGDEGCTPGYWKQEQHFDSYPAGLTPGTDFIGVETGFTYNPSLRSPESGDAMGLSILEALSLRGGQQNALIRHAAAGILNANSGGVAYAYSVAEVQDLYNVDMDKGALEAANEAGCPLN